MPYRHAHRWLLALFPLILIAFWPNYFGALPRASVAMHAHGIAASLWLALLSAQSWTVHARRMPLHRQAGRAVFVATPLFAAAGAMAIVDLARRFDEAVIPFQAIHGARLVMCDSIALAVFVALVTRAVAARRRVRHHAAAMLATSLLVLPPVAGRLLQHVPGYSDDGAFGLDGFALSLHITEIATAGVCWWLWRRDRANASPFLVAGAACVAQSILYETLGASDRWSATTRSLAETPMPVAALLGAAVAMVALALAWKRPAVPVRVAAARA